MNKEQFIEKWNVACDDLELQKNMNEDLDLLIKRQTDLIEHLQNRIRIAESKNENKMKYINADKLKERVKYLKFSIEGIKTVLDLIDELSEEREEQPKLLKVAIKGDCTYDYSKKIFQYFKSHTIKGQHDVDSFLEDVYYYIEKGNIVFSPFLPEGYTEISLKEEGKINQVEAFPEITNLEKRVEAIEQKLKKLSE